MSSNADILEVSGSANSLIGEALEQTRDQLSAQVHAAITEWRRQPSHPRSREARILVQEHPLSLRLTVLSPAAGRTEVLAIFVPSPSSPANGRALSRDRLAMVLERHGVSSREADVARQLIAGKTLSAIAGDIGISLHTVRRHTEQLHKKLGVRSRAALVRRLLDDSASRAS